MPAGCWQKHNEKRRAAGRERSGHQTALLTARPWWTSTTRPYEHGNLHETITGKRAGILRLRKINLAQHTLEFCKCWALAWPTRNRAIQNIHQQPLLSRDGKWIVP